ncbi:MAG: 2-hydroxyacyl-CoA dehydratase [archaeon]|nr:2-hydroxyacyl-CoA dehydratase [archaeon]
MVDEANSIIAYFDSSHDLSEEIIMAAGFLPYKLLGDVHKSTDPADKYLFQTYCPFTRSILTEALENPNKWAGIVVGHGCDATNRHYDIWKAHVETPFLYYVNTPFRNTGDIAEKFFKTELKVFIQALENQYNVEITPKKIKEAIRISNKVKILLQKLGKLRSEKDITNSEYFNVCRMAVQESKTSVIEKLEKILEEWQSKSEFPSKNKKKVLLTGSDITYPEWMELMDECGLRVVRDDLTIGERYYATLIPELEDPLDSLIKYNFNKPCPATKHPPDKRFEYLLKASQETQIDGVVSQNLVFCEVYAFDSVYTISIFKKQNIKITHIERDYTGKADQQLKNRLEAFSEIL